jgi:hypothetical protein
VRVSSEPIVVPAWPFLVANHELGRVDYRTLVAPDFMGDQDASQVLASLPFESEADTEAPFCCELTYQTARQERCKVTVVYQTRTISAESYFKVRPQRAVQVLVGAVFTQPFSTSSPSPELLEECFALYEEDYRLFCHALPPRDFPVVLSWPLATTLTAPASLSPLVSQDATRVHPKPFPKRSAQLVAAQRAERAFPIARTAVLKQVCSETRIQRLWRQLHLFSWFKG